MMKVFKSRILTAFLILGFVPAIHAEQTNMEERLRAIQEQRRRAEERRRQEVSNTATRYESEASAGRDRDLDPSSRLSAPSANESANLSSGSNNAAGAIAQTVGQGLQSQGTSMMNSCCGRSGGASCCSRGKMMLGLGILSLIQSAMNSGAAANHSGIGDLSFAGGGESVDPRRNGESASSPFSPSVQGAIDKLKGKGFAYDSKSGTLKMPGTSDMKLSDLANKSAMADAGISPEDFDKIMSQASALEKKASAEVEKMGAHTEVQGFASGSGSGAREISSTEEETSAWNKKPGLNDPKPTVAGMMKSFNGEMIGVSGDSLFEMMARRYQQKHREEAFLNPESSPSR